MHGIGQQVSGSEAMLTEWLPALNSGLVLPAADKLPDSKAGFYGDLFRPPGQTLSGPETWHDVDPGFEQDLPTA
ncbi:hypothetical protein [Nocardia sp. NPDC057227]|uniref:hypothetical protein n=1 Tax=Nocardia sp. NPDC057227 TaxID=3346056 RepID=UPI00362ABE0A